MPSWLPSFLRRSSEAAELRYQETETRRRDAAAPSVQELTEHPAIRAAAQWCSEILKDPKWGDGGTVTPEAREIYRWALVRAMADEGRAGMLNPYGGRILLQQKYELSYGSAVSRALEEAELSPETWTGDGYAAVDDRAVVIFRADHSHHVVWNAPGWDFDERMGLFGK